MLCLARDSRAILVTCDKDFGELVFRQQRACPGVILLRLAGLERGKRSTRVVGELRAHGGELGSAFCVVSVRSVRIRPIARPSAGD
ncbi:MAG: DUF5615 family PIN-like protein [Phycisphaerae bacterium]|nr:DUF5615 family PIN-like protein [Phycisphaerae bacterium]